MRSADDLTAAARIRDAAIEEFGAHGFAVGLRSIAQSAGVSAALVIHHFGSKDGLRRACDDYVTEYIRAAKSDSMQHASPAAWLAQLAEIESFAPMTAYLMRTLREGGDLAKTLLHTMTENAESYLEEGVRAGTLKPSRDPKARARYLAITGGGGLLLYMQMHDSPNDLRQVLRDYGDEMMAPTLEIYTEGLLTDPGFYQAFLARDKQDET